MPRGWTDGQTEGPRAALLESFGSGTLFWVWSNKGRRVLRAGKGRSMHSSEPAECPFVPQVRFASEVSFLLSESSGSHASRRWCGQGSSKEGVSWKEGSAGLKGRGRRVRTAQVG